MGLVDWALILPLLALIALLLQQICLAIYHLWIHPLRVFPGDWTDHASHIGSVHRAATWRNIHHIHALHRRHGHVVRVNPGELSFTHPDAWRDIYKQSPGGEPELPKDGEQYTQGSGSVVNILFAAHSQHRRMRRLMGPGFSESALARQEAQIQAHVNLYLLGLRRWCGADEFPTADGVVDVAAWNSFYGHDLVASLMFGQSGERSSLRAGRFSPWLAKSRAALRMSTLLGVFSRLPWPVSSVVTAVCLPRRISSGYREHIRLCELAASERLYRLTARDDTDEEDWATSMITRKEHAHVDNNAKSMPVSRVELMDNINVLMPPAVESTATTLDAVMWYLLHSPAWYQRTVAEVRATFAAEAEITVRAAARLPVLAAVTREAMRLHPPVPVALPRRVPRGGRTIAGYFVPEGTVVGVCQLACYRSSLNFRHPDSFAPERWLGDGAFAEDRREAFQPFSTGPRVCIAERFAKAEVSLLLCRLFWNLDMSLMPDNEDMETAQDEVGVWFATPIRVRLHLREGHGTT